ncbi:DUF6644 family protein [Ponticaulis sp.]|uniref:DUF6644 family protein n=1 Tax=Ponticaulis sp. TaxID=2020902 RepID=UPI0025D13266|nr:DUF6644 family protein [Ponticaulis sp.]|tara:strand:+ start:18869 stop:19429 length:561 start_codon:yes stop_codon:yes gene_type:complete
MRDLMLWLDGQQLSIALRESFLVWSALEASHIMTLMLFVGTIVMVDLRILGVLFTGTPVSAIEKRVLPMTMIGFAVLIITGVLLFYAKPLTYYNNMYFRLKLIVIGLAMINIMVFHFRVQRNQDAWDNAAKPPASARVIAGLSLSSWLLVVIFGRLIAYGDWFHCATFEEGDLLYMFSDCPQLGGH